MGSGFRKKIETRKNDLQVVVSILSLSLAHFNLMLTFVFSLPALTAAHPPLSLSIYMPSSPPFSGVTRSLTAAAKL